jgi:hypothetical protein
MKIDCGISQQESYKEMAASYEIFFAGVKNQLPRAKVTSNCGIFGVDKSLFITKSADFMLNTSTGSLVSRSFFKQISFTLNPLFSAASSIQG